jgi:bifunctional non-homologous end joining protein LigD
VKTVSLRGDTGTIDYCLVEDVSTLLWVANLGALELHVPLARASAPDTPTAMVLDLDPGEGVGLTQCIDVGRRITAMLAQMRLQSFAKLSGKKGVHLLVPLNTPDVTFQETRTFAKALAQVLTRDDPTRITADISKDQRNRRILVDWNQNSSSKTMVSVYSLRAALTPTISFPIDLRCPPTSLPTPMTALPSIDAMRDVLSLKQKLPAVQ